MVFVWIFATFLIATIILYLLTDPHRKYSGKNYLDGPRGLPFLGSAVDFMSSDPRVILIQVTRLLKEWNGRLRLALGHHRLILVSDPKDIEKIMTDQRFLKKSNEYDILRPWLQDGLLTVSEKSKWHSRRKTLTPAFHFKILDEFVEVMDAQAKTLVDIMQPKATNQPFDIAKYINLYTLDVICETSMGVSVNAQIDSENEYVKSIEEISKLLFWRTHHFLARDDWFFNITPQKPKHDKLIKTIHTFTQNVIENRRKQKMQEDVNKNVNEDEFGIKKRRALLDILLEATVNGEPLTTKEIHEEVDNFMFAGHDTTTSAIQFMLYNLGKHQDVQEKVYQEIIDNIGSDSSIPITLSNLNNLNYLDLVIKESLRTFASVPIIGRYISEDIEINGKIYPANHNILIGIHMMHNNPDLFPEPEKFKPERFIENKSHEESNAYCYVPFSAGYRNCIGQKFAQYEIKTAILRFLQKYKISLKEGFKPELAAEIILRPLNGIWIKLEERK